MDDDPVQSSFRAMITRTKTLALVAAALAVSAVYLGLRSPAAPDGFGPAGGLAGPASGIFAYELTRGRVEDPGRTVPGPSGPATIGRRIRALAEPIRAGFPGGEFGVVLDAVPDEPDASRPGPRTYRITGTWAIVSDAAGPSGREPEAGAVLGGPIEGRLPFDPASHPGLIRLTVELPVSTVWHGRGQGRVIFLVNERFEGRLTGAFEPQS